MSYRNASICPSLIQRHRALEGQPRSDRAGFLVRLGSRSAGAMKNAKKTAKTRHTRLGCRNSNLTGRCLDHRQPGSARQTGLGGDLPGRG
jgi:hypothetical protein